MSAALRLVEFSENTATALVTRRLQDAGAPASAAALRSFAIRLVEHLHGLIRETRPTREEWSGVLRALTEIGHASDERRQEWALLFDLLGASALVEAINSTRPKGATPNTARGPLYRAGAPKLRNGAGISLDGRGEPLEVSIRIEDLDGMPVVGAELETWQANGDGWYENQEPDLQPEWNLRGRFRSDDDGRVHYRTIKPAGYELPTDGPIGEICRLLKLSVRRPAQLHFTVSAHGFETLNAEIFDSADPDLAADALFAVREPLLGEFLAKADGWSLQHRFVLARSRERARL